MANIQLSRASKPQAVDAAEAEMAEAFLRGEVTGRPPSAPAAAEPGRHVVPFAEVRCRSI